MTNSKAMRQVKRKLLEDILAGEISDKGELEKAKRRKSKAFNLPKVPSNAEILDIANEEEKDNAVQILRKKPVRSISGVTVITVMPKPYECPKDKPCIYCPGGPAENTPQSYTGKEPASARALNADYDPKKQIQMRKSQLRAIGHKVDKVELIIFGGTFLAQPLEYQEEFMHACIDEISEIETPDLETAKRKAENANIRTIGITFETRPDYSKENHVDQMLRFGGTRVELGVQTIYNDIYKIINREHTVDDVIEATRIAKDAGLAIVYHMMPGLPGSSPQRDLEAFETIFDKPEFRPDMLKIYPCLVTKGTKLHELWKSGKFDPLDGQEAVDLISEIKKKIPRWTRIQRIQRDIPSGLIEAGVKKGNIRNIAKKKLAKEGEKCKCIRCREVGHKMLKEKVEPDPSNIELIVENYEASEGKEIFISLEDLKNDLIFGHLRLRIPSEHAHQKEISEDTSLIRMLYVFGELVSVGEDSHDNAWQHIGLGKRMLVEAEKIASENYDSNKMYILSGIGTRPYYRKFGYKLEGPYMAKNI